MDEEEYSSIRENLLLNRSAEENTTGTENVSVELQILRPSTRSYTARRVAGISGSDIPFIDQSQVTSPRSDETGISGSDIPFDQSQVTSPRSDETGISGSEIPFDQSQVTSPRSDEMSRDFEGMDTSQSFATRTLTSLCGSSFRFANVSTIASPASQSSNVASSPVSCNKPLNENISGAVCQRCESIQSMTVIENFIQCLESKFRRNPQSAVFQIALLLSCLYFFWTAFFAIQRIATPVYEGYNAGYTRSNIDFIKSCFHSFMHFCVVIAICYYFMKRYSSRCRRYPLDTPDAVTRRSVVNEI